MIHPVHYAGAVIRLATFNKKNQTSRLLNATVTLIPQGRPLPPPMKKPLNRYAIRSKTGETIFFRRTLLNAQDAICWYRSLGQGKDKTPSPSKVEECNSHCDGINIETAHLTDDPPWPNLKLPM